jgi:hypothetical protein
LTWKKNFNNNELTNIAMRTFLILFFFVIYFQLNAQKADSIGYLSNLMGKGLCIRAGNQTNLKIPFFFLKGDIVKITSGKAVLVLYTEDEVKLGTGESYTFSFDNDLKSKNKDLVIYKNTKQSNCSFKMRGIGDPKIIIFPKKSRIIDPSKAIIQIISKKKDKYFFKLTDAKNIQAIFQLFDVDNKYIKLGEAQLVKGSSYTWKIKFAENEAIGEIEVLSDEKVKQFPVFEFSNRSSFVNAFNFYCNEECYFDAYQVIDNAIKAYPDDEYFVYLKNSLY